ncbi:MAG TPA: hypothetical protein VE967_00430 [Gemmatimonadaceae bacterium]|nr:hypothetical protein [Gemmatimonadaceae bacterium]
MKIASVLLASAIAFASSSAQPSSPPGKNVPIRPLGAVEAISNDTLGQRIVTRGLSDGRVLVGVFPYGLPNPDPNRRRVKLFDKSLQSFQLVRDSSQIPTLIRFTGDSTLILDVQSRALLVLDPGGKIARTMALPKTQDFSALQGFIHIPAIDPQGRLVYQGNTPQPPQRGPNALPFQLPFFPDSAPIVRANFDTRTIDTVAKIRIVRQATLTVKPEGVNYVAKVVAELLSWADEWTMLPDGTIAIVRGQDYHIDWYAPDGTKSSTPKMPFDWRRITDEEKKHAIDSIGPILDSARTQMQPQTFQTPDGVQSRITITFEAPPMSALPDYESPIGPGSVRADLDGNVWIVPRTSAAAQGGLLYDVVNRKGELVERVQFPKGVALVGFGPGGVVYLNRIEGNAGFLQRAKIR